MFKKHNKSVTSVLVMLVVSVLMGCQGQSDQAPPNSPAEISVEEWMPESVHKAGNTQVKKAKYPAIDMHAHHYVETEEELDRRVEIMDQAGIEESVVLTGVTGAEFDSVYAFYSKYPDRFDLYCGIDYTGYEEEGWSEKAVRDLRHAVETGAVGIGEMSDKGDGLNDGFVMHPDDPRMDPIFEEAGKLNIPVNLHVAEPVWMYHPMDSTNDGFTRSYTWRVKNKHELLSHDEMLDKLGATLERHPNTNFVAAHIANTSNDFSKIAELFDKYPNLYADISARFSEFGTIPRTTAAFFEKYQDRIVYGTDYGWETFNNDTDYGNNTTTLEMFRMTFRVLETTDEHFYMTDLLGYKWPLYGLNLEDNILKKIYRENALKIVEGN